MYIELAEAREIVRKRWLDLEIRRKVLEYVGEVPDFLQHGPRAVLARQLATPNFEFLHFSGMALKSGLRPIVIEYTGDKFCTKNRDKLLLAKMMFFHGKGRKKGNDISSRRIVDFNKYDGRTFTRVKTLWKEDFIDFHHRLLFQNSPEMATTDVTEWLSRMGGNPKLFWPRLLALFICHGILFDNFHTEGHEVEFTKNVIRPAIQATEERFGLKPLIVRLVPHEKEEEAFWSWYPDRFEEEVRYLINPPEDEISARQDKRISI
jgi:hypothetical protein